MSLRRPRNREAFSLHDAVEPVTYRRGNIFAPRCERYIATQGAQNLIVALLDGVRRSHEGFCARCILQSFANSFQPRLQIVSAIDRARDCAIKTRDLTVKV